MEDMEQSSLEEKVDIENLVLFPLDSHVNKETEEENFRIKDESSEIKTNDDISENYYIKKETIELPFDEYEKEPIEFSTNYNEMGQKEEEAISFNTETPTPALQDYSALKIVHQGDEQINKSIQGIPPKKNMNFETTMKTQNEKKTSRSNFLLKEDWNQYCQRQKKLLSEQQNTNLIEKARVEHNIEIEDTMLQNNGVKFYPKSSIDEPFIPKMVQAYSHNPEEVVRAIRIDLNEQSKQENDKIIFDSDTEQTYSQYSFTDGKQHLIQTMNSDIAPIQEGKLNDGSKIKQSNNGSKIKLLCPFCTLSYPSKKCLNRHIAIAHEGKMQENKFKCTLCDNAAFTQKHNLKKHIESFHEGKKAFICNICDLRFTQNGGLKKHIESVHEGKKAFICNICYKRFVQKIHLKRDTKSYHEGKKV